MLLQVVPKFRSSSLRMRGSFDRSPNRDDEDVDNLAPGAATRS